MPSERTHNLPLDRLVVLVVDDIEPNRALLRRRLQRMGFSNLLEAPDGRQALEVIRSQRIDLVLLDIMMPVMTGYEVLQAMRADPLANQPPVIVISALSEMDSVVRAIELGAEDYMLKPFDPTLLRARVVTTLEKKLLRDEMALELSRKRQELSEARQLQLALKPASLHSPHLRIDAVMEPAMEVGGDLVDHFALSDGRHVLALGDVSGKGAGAALMMARCHALLRSLAARQDREALFDTPELAMDGINRELATNNLGCHFITFFLAVFTPSSGHLQYVRCGHVEPFVRHADGRQERLHGTSQLPLGLDDQIGYRSSATTLQPGARLLILSDGVTEAVDLDHQPFGEERVVQWLDQAPDDIDTLVQAVRTFEQGAPASDDLTCLFVMH